MQYPRAAAPLIDSEIVCGDMFDVHEEIFFASHLKKCVCVCVCVCVQGKLEFDGAGRLLPLRWVDRLTIDMALVPQPPPPPPVSQQM